MAEKTTTLIVNVDLDCRRCYKQIRKVLCKLQATADQERIRTISYDGKNHTIYISGPFDPLQLCGKIRCMGGKVIRDIQIKQPDPPPPPPPQCTCKQDIEQLKLVLAELQRELRVCVEQYRDFEQLKQDVEELQRQLRVCVHQNQDIEQLKRDVAELKEQAQKCAAARRECHGRPCRPDDTPVIDIPSAGCSHPWCYSGRYEGCRCGGYAAVRPPLVGCHGGACGCYRGCQFVTDEDAPTGCSVM